MARQYGSMIELGRALRRLVIQDILAGSAWPRVVACRVCVVLGMGWPQAWVSGLSRGGAFRG